MGYRIPKAGECYRHFKGNRYRVLTTATHTETGEELVIYEALYGDNPVFARPIEMFTGKVDHEKFPDVTQEYRFELEEDTVVPDAGEHSLLMQFLDLSTNEEKVKFLQRIKLDITDEFLTAVAQSLEFTESQKTLEMRYEDIIHYLKMLMKYEKRI